MRDSKKAKYILLPLVLAIWGGALWLYLSGDADNSTQAAPALPPELSLSDTSSTWENDTFHLVLDYPDPFKGEKWQHRPQARTAEPGSSARSERPAKKPEPEAPEEQGVNWSQFRYQGRVRSSGDTTQVALLSISGKLYSVRRGLSYQGAQILQIWTDSIRIQYQDEIQTLRH